MKPESPRRINPGYRELIPLLAAFLLVLVIASLSYGVWAAFLRSRAELAISRRIVTAAAALLSSLKDAETGQRGFLLTGDEHYLEPYRRTATEIPELIRTLTAAASYRRPDQARRVANLKPLVKEKLDELQQTVELRRHKGFDAALAALRADRGKAAMDQIRRISAEIQATSSDRLSEYAEQSRAEASRLGVIATSGSIALLVLLILATATIRRETLRRQELIGALQESEHKAKESGYWLQTTLASIGDGVIATDTAGNVTFLNPMAGSLTGWTQKQAAGMPLDVVFTINQEDTGAAIENPVSRSLREGCVVVLANHTTLTARDGRQVPIEDSAAPIRDGNGVVKGAVLVFRDVSERKKAEKELKQAGLNARAEILRSERQLRSVVDSMDQLAWIARADGWIFWYNARWYEYTGTTPEQMEGWGWQSVHDPATLPAVMSKWTESIRTGQPFDMVHPLRGSDGIFRTFLTRIRPVRDEEGTLVRWFGTNTDVEAIQKAEAAVRRSEERLRTFLAASSDGVYRMSPDWREMLQLKGQNFIAETDRPNARWLEDYIPPDDRELVKAAFREAIRTRSVFELEHRVQRPDGTVGWTFSRAIPVLDPAGEIVEWFGAASDVTDRKRSEENLLESEEHFRTLANLMSQFAWMTDEKGTVSWYNQRWYDYTGATPEALQGWGWRQVHHPDHVDRVLKHLSHCFQTGEDWEDTFPLRGKDGQYRWFLSRAQPLRNAAGKIVRWIGTNTDITGQRETETQLRRANFDLEQFAYSSSHDLQEPLRMISLYSQMLIKGHRGQLGGDAPMCVGYITEGTARMRELLADLLGYTRLNDASLQSEPVDMNLIFEKALENLQAAIQENHAVVTREDLPTVNGHPAHLVQLLQNLIGNSIKYRGPSAPRIHLSAVASNESWRMSVSDNGMGIDPEYHKTIFGVFKRLHGRQIPGTGIGLAVCQRVVERAGGRIWVESRVDEGATFYCTLPFVQGIAA